MRLVLLGLSISSVQQFVKAFIVCFSNDLLQMGLAGLTFHSGWLLLAHMSMTKCNLCILGRVHVFLEMEAVTTI